MRAVKGITELITVPGMVNLDFADVRAIMQRGGVAMIGMGESEGPSRVEDAVSRAIRSPLIDVDISGATAALVNVTGGPDMTLAEAGEAAKLVHQMISSDARIIWGVQVHPEMQGFVRVLLILTGVRSPQIYGRSERKQSEVQNHFEIDFLK
jgi:cell division protein FtsZ